MAYLLRGSKMIQNSFIVVAFCGRRGVLRGWSALGSEAGR